MNSPYLKAFLFTAFCVAASFAVTWAMSHLLVNSFPPESLVIAVVVPLVIATPLSIFIALQRQKIDLARRDLKAALASLEGLHADAEHRARTDLMTGVLNRESFIQSISDNRRKDDQGVFLMLDADKFKTINDTWGHQAGDEALISIVGAINETVRENDVVGRLGGEEFGVFLTGTDLNAALPIAERIRKAVENTRFCPVDDHVHPLTISAGAAVHYKGRDVSDLMKCSDDLLYQAKEQGRNRIVAEDIAAEFMADAA